jgi:hypothetical protein
MPDVSQSCNLHSYLQHCVPALVGALDINEEGGVQDNGIGILGHLGHSTLRADQAC